jgi:hypothetical protein
MVLYIVGLIPGVFAPAWEAAFALWALFTVSSALKTTPEEALVTWLAAYLWLPKRDPNPDFVSGLNAAAPTTVFPLVELVIAVAAMAVFVSARSRIESGRSRRIFALCGYGFIAAAISGWMLTEYNRFQAGELFNEFMASYARSRCLRHLAEGLVIASLPMISLGLAAHRLRSVCLIAAGITASEFLIWALPVAPNDVTRFLYDFRGGYRPLIFGYGGGAMQAIAWILVLGVMYITKGTKWMAGVAVLSILGCLFSLHRTQAFSLAVVLVGAGVFMAPRAYRVPLVICAALILPATGVGLLDPLRQLTSGLSERKGSEYLSMDSMQSRIDLARLSLHALRDSPVLGIGPNGLTWNTMRLLVQGSSVDSAFIDTLVLDQDVLVGGERVFDSHNLLVSLVTESGLIGIGIVAGMFVLGYDLFRARHTPARFVALLAWLGTILTGFAQAEPYMLCPVFVLAAFALQSDPPLTSRVPSVPARLPMAMMQRGPGRAPRITK